MVRAVEKVRERLVRATRALDSAGVAHAVVGGHAVAAWVTRVDEAAVRATQDVDILLNRDDLRLAVAALESAGFQYRHVKGLDIFLDGAEGKARDAVHVVFAGERVRPEYADPAPTLGESEIVGAMRVVSLPALVRMKLTSFRDKDRMHLRDLIDVELVDATWIAQLPPALGERLTILLETPDG